MDTAQWPQEIVMKPMEEIVPNTCSKPSLERRVRTHKEQVLNCPRCSSTNTKFCYYNNYSLSQPRYFCKTCRRYWTEGGSLRNIPVGGGSRKIKRSLSSTSSSVTSLSAANASNQLPDLVVSTISHHNSQNPKINEGQDLNLGFPASHDFKTITELIQVPSFDGSCEKMAPSSSSSQLSALELLTGITSRAGLNSFMPMPIGDLNTDYPSGFAALPEFRSSLNFSLDGLGNSGCDSLQLGMQETNGGRVLFPFEDLKQVSSATEHSEQNRDNQNGDSSGYWNGMLGGSW